MSWELIGPSCFNMEQVSCFSKCLTPDKQVGIEFIMNNKKQVMTYDTREERDEEFNRFIDKYAPAFRKFAAGDQVMIDHKTYPNYTKEHVGLVMTVLCMDKGRVNIEYESHGSKVTANMSPEYLKKV